MKTIKNRKQGKQKMALMQATLEITLDVPENQLDEYDWDIMAWAINHLSIKIDKKRYRKEIKWARREVKDVHLLDKNTKIFC